MPTTSNTAGWIWCPAARIEWRYFCDGVDKKTGPALVITSTLAQAAWHLSHSTCRISLAAELYAFTATLPAPAVVTVA